VQAVSYQANAVIMSHNAGFQAHWWYQIKTVASYSQVSFIAKQPGASATLSRALGSVSKILIPLLNTD